MMEFLSSWLASIFDVSIVFIVLFLLSGALYVLGVAIGRLKGKLTNWGRLRKLKHSSDL
jgi:hypothetical protein